MTQDDSGIGSTIELLDIVSQTCAFQFVRVIIHCKTILSYYYAILSQVCSLAASDPLPSNYTNITSPALKEQMFTFPPKQNVVLA